MCNQKSVFSKPPFQPRSRPHPPAPPRPPVQLFNTPHPHPQEYLAIRLHTSGGPCCLDLLELGLPPGLFESAAGGADAAEHALGAEATQFAEEAAAAAASGMFAAAAAAAGAGGESPAAAAQWDSNAASPVHAASAAERLAAIRLLIGAAMGLQNDTISVVKDAADGCLMNAAVQIATRIEAAQAACGSDDDRVGDRVVSGGRAETSAATAFAPSVAVTAAAAAAPTPLQLATDAVVSSADQMLAAAAQMASAPLGTAHASAGSTTLNGAASAAAAAALRQYHAAASRLTRAIVSVMLGAAQQRYGESAAAGQAVPEHWKLLD